MSSLVNGEEIEDGFRESRRRPQGWREAAIADGSVRAPGAPDPDEGKDYTNATVISLNLEKAGAELSHVWMPGESFDDPALNPRPVTDGIATIKGG